MNTEYTAIITKDDDWWLGWIEEVPGANAQERTKDELIISLKEAVKDIIDLRRQQMRSEIKDNFEELLLVV
ncbi:MAG: type II toxin-antitoxin system HicB family antitoxin [Desulfamplus sp.]|nr:type II toxin-antitoxin system HicB family antitoxin [Desulfamplus sp.]